MIYRITLKFLSISYKTAMSLDGLTMSNIASLLILLVFCGCAVEPSADTSAIRDQRHVLGMVLVEEGGKQLLEMVICEVGEGREIGSGELADRSICRNAFVDNDGDSYYFSELTDKDLKHQATIGGYLKLAAIVAIPIVLGVVVGRNANKLKKLKKLIPLVDENGKLIFRKANKPKKDLSKAQENLDKFLADKELTTQVGFWGGVIGAIVTEHRGNPIVWGKGDRKLISNWDEIFKVHSRGFEQSKELDDQRAIKQILATIAQRLSIKVNPEVNL